MKIHTKVRYGLRAMIEIANSPGPKGSLQKDIARNQELPLNYLDNIISCLRNAGLITNYDGKSSGYILARPADQISVYDIYRAFEPELNLVNCKCPTNECKRINICPVTDYWFELNKQIKEFMMSSTIDKISSYSENISVLNQ